MLKRWKPFATAHAWSGVVSWCLVLLGGFLRAEQFASNRSIFIDEAALALNLRDRTLPELLGTLDYAQTAPPGYLILQKIITEAMGRGEFALRLLPFLAGLAALPVFMLFARRYLPAHLAPVAVAAFALADYQIFWATDAKPYAIDVLATLALLVFALAWAQSRDRDARLRLAIAGAVAPYFSHAAVIVLAAIACVFFISAVLSKPRRLGEVTFALLPWIAGVPAVLHALLSMSVETKAYMDAFWHEGFLPLPINLSALAAWHRSFHRIIIDPLGYSIIAVGWSLLLLCVIGLVLSIKRTPVSGWLFGAPILATLTLSVLGQYPLNAKWTYAGRVVLFLAPLIVVGALAAIAYCSGRSRVGAVFAGVLLIAPAIIPGALNTSRTRGEARGALAYVSARALPTDVVYLSYALRLAYDYYRPGIEGQVIFGRCAQADPEAYAGELERYRGSRRIWVVQSYDLYSEARILREYMRLNAVQLDSIVLPIAEARLYSFPLGEPVPLPDGVIRRSAMPDPRTDCEGVFSKLPYAAPIER